EKALETYPEALKLFEACHDQGSALITTSSIGSVYGRQRKFEEAIEYFEKVALSARQMNQKVTMMIALSNLAFCLRQVGRTRRVGRYFEEA
ncbi:tetratricopeptide repeat protein, partial [Candidatus Saccharibacteria bacterium]|nr:tetratricopeptide repeat protein [Candidatus Saccharibacteria bacterium]